LYAAAAADDEDDDDDRDVIRRLSWWKEPRATWCTLMESMLPAARSWEYSSNVSRKAASNCTEKYTETHRRTLDQQTIITDWKKLNSTGK